MGKLGERRRVPFGLFVTGGLVAVVALVLISLFVGTYSMGWGDVWAVLRGRGARVPAIQRHVVLELRLPRAVLAALVGAALALAGTTLQSVLRNPLASPDVMGTSSASGFGAALGILLFPGHAGAAALCAFLTGMSSLALLFLLCRAKGDGGTLTLVLSGIIVSSVFVSLIGLVKFAADAEDVLPAVTFWLMGSFAGSGPRQLGTMAVPFVLGTAVLVALRWKLNILSLGDDEALALGVDPRVVRGAAVTAAALLISASVTVSGMVGWVGLVVPHMARRLTGANHGHVVPLSAVLGAGFAVTIDMIARSIGFFELPVSIVAALLGVPVFVALVFLKRG